jgi:hypothetical protein
MTGKRNMPLLITAAALGLLIFGGIGVAGAIWLWLRPQSESVSNNQARISDINSANNKNSVYANSQNIAPSPSVSPADDEFKRLSVERENASPGQVGKIIDKLEEAEKKYPNDYRFPFERALLLAPSPNHHPAYSALAESARAAIKNDQAAQMAVEMGRYRDTVFRRISGGHKEWTAIENALNRRDLTLLPEDEH